MNEDRLHELVRILEERQQTSKLALDKLREFSSLLYDGIEHVIAALNKNDITSVSKPERKQLTDDMESFSFDWFGQRLIFVPLAGAALLSPNSREAVLTGTLSGKLVVFFQATGQKDAGVAIYEFNVFPSGAWSSQGFGFPSSEDSFNEEILKNMSITFFMTLTNSLTNYWPELREIPFTIAVQGSQIPFGFKTKEVNE